ncbi:MAG TPA: Mut7-C RNAse domain-containing protein [Chloroflexota bacterium]|nr:Mut7-C RNAse domain-containing protein [Chloroflexota bacterium]
MAMVSVRFYAELGDFVLPSRRQVTFTHSVPDRASVKDVIESLGVPHTEVDLVLVNGESVDFSYQVQDGDRISVYPVFESLDITPLVRVRPQPLREPRFVLDTHLGKLAGYLRLLGFDTLYRNDYADPLLVQLARQERRILLTRDRGLLKHRLVTHGYHVWETDPRRQVVEVLRRFDLAGAVAPFRRCLRCNGLLVPVPKREVAEQLPPKTRQYYDDFRRCAGCGRVYWKGSHYDRMLGLVQSVLAQLREAGQRGTAADDPPSQ